MRRNIKQDDEIKQLELTKQFVFNWTVCCLCDSEVKWERMYKFMATPYVLDVYRKYKHICGSCALGTEAAVVLAQHHIASEDKYPDLQTPKLSNNC